MNVAGISWLLKKDERENWRIVLKEEACYLAAVDFPL